MSRIACTIFFRGLVVDSKTEEKALKYLLWFVAVIFVLVLFGAVESESAKLIMGGTFLGVIIAGIASNRVLASKSDANFRAEVAQIRAANSADLAPQVPIERSSLPPAPRREGLQPQLKVLESEPPPTLTGAQQQAIADHVRRANDSAVQRARLIEQSRKQSSGIPHSPAAQTPRHADLIAGPPSSSSHLKPLPGDLAASPVCDPLFEVHPELPTDAESEARRIQQERRERYEEGELARALVWLQDQCRNQSFQNRMLIEQRLKNLEAGDFSVWQARGAVQSLGYDVMMGRIGADVRASARLDRSSESAK